MPIYKYKAKDARGKDVTGTLVAPNEQAVTTRLDEMGYTPISIAIDKKPKGTGAKKGKKVAQHHMIAFTRQFATIVKAGVPIVSGLTILSEQTESPALKEVLAKVVHDIEGGASLSQALDKHPASFSELYVNTVVAGEAGGVLDRVLLRLAEMMERDNETRQNVSAALRYPLITIVAMFIASFVLVTFVVPKFATMYARFDTALPLPTRVLIASNHLIKNWWFIVIPSMAAAGYLFVTYINTKQGRYQWDSFKLKVPVFGELFVKVSMARFAMMLSTLNESGLPILRSLEIVAATVGNAVIGRDIDRIKTSVADGRGISESIMGSAVFPPMVAHMVSIGEKTGAIEDMLNSIADYYDLEIKTMVKNLTTLIEPIMTAVLGVVVLGMALAIFLPLWNMIQLFRG
ncbi:MAG: type II secretion system F family protein [Candidatus Omnitrophica bacterium]|nr:type II secretion system F family protein [Candidatus Omnitrophota bacterium]